MQNLSLTASPVVSTAGAIKKAEKNIMEVNSTSDRAPDALKNSSFQMLLSKQVQAKKAAEPAIKSHGEESNPPSSKAKAKADNIADDNETLDTNLITANSVGEVVMSSMPQAMLEAASMLKDDAIQAQNTNDPLGNEALNSTSASLLAVMNSMGPVSTQLQKHLPEKVAALSLNKSADSHSVDSRLVDMIMAARAKPKELNNPALGQSSTLDLMASAALPDSAQLVAKADKVQARAAIGQEQMTSTDLQVLLPVSNLAITQAGAVLNNKNTPSAKQIVTLVQAAASQAGTAAVSTTSKQTQTTTDMLTSAQLTSSSALTKISSSISNETMPFTDISAQLATSNASNIVSVMTAIDVASSLNLTNPAELATNPFLSKDLSVSTDLASPDLASPDLAADVALQTDLVLSAQLNTSAPVVQALQEASANYIHAHPGKTGWDQAIGQKIVWMVGAEQQSATLNLNPPDLGPLQVVINVQNDQADTSFISDNAEVRQALQDGMDNLRNQMRESGIQLGQTNVSSGQQAQQQFQQAMQGRQTSKVSANQAPSVSTSAEAAGNIAVDRVANGLVDTFV